MKVETLREAIAEANRFIKTAKEMPMLVGLCGDIDWCPKESGACRRASMDLTRKLADLRQGR